MDRRWQKEVPDQKGSELGEMEVGGGNYGEWNTVRKNNHKKK